MFFKTKKKLDANVLKGAAFKLHVQKFTDFW